MSASGTVSDVCGGDSSRWLPLVREEDRGLMSLIEPFIYFENELSFYKRGKRAEQFLVSPYRYIPLLFPDFNGTTQKVYLYYRSLEFLNIPIEYCHDTDFHLKVYNNLLQKLKELTLRGKLQLLCAKSMIENYRAQGMLRRSSGLVVKKIDAKAEYKFLLKYNKSSILYLIKTALNAMVPGEDVPRTVLEWMNNFDSSNSSVAEDELVSNINLLSEEEKAQLLSRSVKFKVSVGTDYSAVLTNSGLQIDASWNEQLGSGKFSMPRKAFNYSRGELAVHKAPIFNTLGQKHIRNEIRLMEIIYRGISEKKLSGLMDRITAVVTFPEPNNPSKIYQEQLRIRYPQSIRRYLHREVTAVNPLLTFDNILSGAIQLFLGLCHLQTLGILHGDIKLENVMLESERPLIPLLIDFGGSILESEAEKYVESFYGPTFSPMCFNRSDCLEMARYAMGRQFDQWVLVHRARDVTALLLLLLEVFSKQYIPQEGECAWIGGDHMEELLSLFRENHIPCPEIRMKGLHVLLDLRLVSREEITQMLESTGCARPELIDLFMSGLQDDWRLRPSASAILQSLIGMQSHP